MDMELIDGSETSAIINHTPGSYPKGNLLYIKLLVAVACFLPGRAKDLSAPLYICTEVLISTLTQPTSRCILFDS